MDDLHLRLDELVLRVRRAQTRPQYRRRLLSDVSDVHGMAQLRALRAVERFTSGGARPSIRDVAEYLQIEHSTASRAIHETVRAGLVEKSPCEDDQRRTRLELTERGCAALAQATDNRRRMLADVVAGWSERDTARLVELLDRLVEGFDAVETDPHG